MRSIRPSRITVNWEIHKKIGKVVNNICYPYHLSYSVSIETSVPNQVIHNLLLANKKRELYGLFNKDTVSHLTRTGMLDYSFAKLP